MVSQKKTRDILDALLGKPLENTAPGTEELEKLIHQEPRNKPSPEGKKRQGKTPARNTKNRGKKKTTHYLSGKVFQELSEAKQKINDLVPSPLKSRVSKSQIVNQALKMILDDFEQKGEKSTLVKQLLKNPPDNSDEGLK